MSIDAIYEFVKDNGPVTFKEIVEYSNADMSRLGDLHYSLMMDGRFFCLPDGTWDASNKFRYSELHSSSYQEDDDEDEEIDYDILEDEDLEDTTEDDYDDIDY